MAVNGVVGKSLLVFLATSWVSVPAIAGNDDRAKTGKECYRKAVASFMSVLGDQDGLRRYHKSKRQWLEAWVGSKIDDVSKVKLESFDSSFKSYSNGSDELIDVVAYYRVRVDESTVTRMFARDTLKVTDGQCKEIGARIIYQPQ
jgi:hypothetical protein